MYVEGVSWEEVSVARVYTRLPDLVSSLVFDNSKELVWAGTERGWLVSLQVPTLARYTSFRAQGSKVCDLLSVNDGVFSVGPGGVCFHTAEGLCKYMYRDKPQVSYSCAVVESSHSGQVVVGQQGGGVTIFNLSKGQLVAEHTCDGVVSLKHQGVRGGIVAGGASGRIFTLDPRSSYKQEQSINAHPGGLSCMDLKNDILTTCGYTMRMGRKYLEAYVKVFDMRSTARLLSTIPFTACPSLLAFHPKFSTTLVVAAPSGVFALADVSGSLVGQAQQIECEGDSLLSMSISSSGEAVTFGGSGGYVHMWARSKQPRGNTYGQVLVSHPPYTPNALSLGEDDPLAVVPTYAHHVAADEKLLSAVDGSAIATVGRPPKVIDASLLQNMKQVDFVGYIPNPKYQRGASRGESTKAVAQLRNMRQKPAEEKDTSAIKAARAREREAQGGIELPERYKKMSARAGINARRFDEFNFNAYNRTRFAGLENDITNCYANALLQCLHFIPGVRNPCLTAEPQPDKEFQLLCELGFLFRMFRNANGAACQASNFLRALRQNREAAALGLLEGQAGGRGVREGTATDIEVEANKDKKLSQRVQRLCGFLMEQLHKEAGVSNSFIDALFGMTLRQQTVCLVGKHQPITKDIKTFMVKLQYPPAKDRPTAVPASAHTPLTPLPAADRPSFSEVLAATLHSRADMRAWFDEQVRYAPVCVTRCPVKLPFVMVIGCGPQDRGDLSWWMPYPPDPTSERPHTCIPWLPLAIAIELEPEEWKVKVSESSKLSDLQSSESHSLGALYELTALICHVWDQDELGEPAQPEEQKKMKEKKEGHLIAHIKVPPLYYQTSASSLMTPKSPSIAGTVLPSPFLDKGISMTRTMSRSGSSTGHLSRTSSCNTKALDDGSVATSTPDKDAEGPVLELQRSSSLPDSLNTLSISTTLAVPNPPAAGVPASTAAVQNQGPPGLLRRNSSGSSRKSEWMMFNDFCVAPTPVSEVCDMFGTQKVPCLLYYTQVTPIEAAMERAPPPLNRCCSVDKFLSVCQSPPLQGAGKIREPFSFVPFSADDLPLEGNSIALDAEFVAMAPPEKTIQRMGGGIDIETRPSRLSVARISVVRGEGPRAGTAAMDDYIRMVEPVYDYLTKFSGLVAGDLDPKTSQHYLTTLKSAYTKLQFLIDSGCIFVGHGLKQDFRMINLVVPPHQVVDTVDLFRLPNQRKVSLRFLASYFLALDIQTNTHDSIEDAKTAFKLYNVYQKLVAAGKFEESIITMYRYGNEHNWIVKDKPT